MIETRLTRKAASRTERIKRAWTSEGFILLAIMGLWAMLLLSSAPSIGGLIACAALFGIGVAFLSAVLVAGNAAAQVLFAGTVGFTTLFIGLVVFGDSLTNFGVLCASATTFLCMDLLRLHELRRRSARVQPALLSTGLMWASGIVVVSAILVLLVARPGEATLPWGYLPLATVGVFLVLGGLGFWAISDRSRQSGARYDAVVLTPPAPNLVDPLVAEALHATAMMHGAAPPPPMRAPQLPQPAKAKGGRRGR